MSQLHTCNRNCRRHGCYAPSHRARARLSFPAEPLAGGAPDKADRQLVLLYFDQSDYDPAQRRISNEDAHVLQKLVGGRFENHGQTFRENRRMPAAPPRFTPSHSSDSPESISVQEMRANVGEPQPRDSSDCPFPRHFQQRAEEKIRSIGRGNYTGDVKAVVISGGNVVKTSYKLREERDALAVLAKEDALAKAASESTDEAGV